MESRTTAPPAGLEEIFERHAGQVYRAALRITGDGADAEDVLQTVFLRLTRRDEEIDLSRTASSYLHRAAVNAALDLLRRRKRLRVVPLEEGAAVPDDTVGPDRDRDLEELRRGLRQALATLSPRSAEIFVLRYFEDWPNREIARLLGTSQATVAVTLHRARARLRKALKPLAGGLS